MTTQNSGRKLITEVIHKTTSKEVSNENNIDFNKESVNESDKPQSSSRENSSGTQGNKE